ncbi:hypothetical protein AC1031_002362 [Aphanomyces cochlioides]|nr:hypothetical protein AC1031_002362 [Aphanomyces cochlioides]
MPDHGQLPTEIIQRIALFLPQSDTFFAFLDTFAKEEIGVLRHYLVLRGLMSPELLWPCLNLTRSPPESALHHIECLSACISSVRVSPAFDVMVVCPFLAPTNVVIDGSSCKGGLKGEMLNKMLRLASSWKQLQSVAFTHVNKRQVGVALQCLRRTYITTFEIANTVIKDNSDDVADINDIVDAEPQHNQLEWVISWLQTVPARHFSTDCWYISQGNSDLMPILYNAVANCQTLKTFSIADTTLHGWNEYIFQKPLPMNKLVIKNGGLDTASVPTLISGLQSSRLRDLAIKDDTRRSYLGPKGLRTLLNALPLTNVTRLTVQGAMLADRGCLVLAKVLPSLKLTYLDISYNHISENGARHLAQVLPNALRLQHLVMAHNFLEPWGMVDLIEAWASPTLPPRILDLRQNSLSSYNLTAVQPAYDRFSSGTFEIQVDYRDSGSWVLLTRSK